MNVPCLRPLIAAALLASCAGAAAQSYPTDHVRLYEAGEISPDSYTVVKRLWTGTWRSAFFLPSFPDAAAAIEAMKQEAAGAGANAVTNVVCIPDATLRPRASGVYCHGVLIKMN